MRRSKSVAIGTAFLAAVAMALAGSSDAQPSAVTEESFLRAALIVTTFTKLEDACHKSHGFSPQQSTHIATWRVANRVDEIRARLPELTQHPSQKQQVDKNAADLLATISAHNRDPCSAATAFVRLPDAQFAQRAPQVRTDLTASEAQPAVVDGLASSGTDPSMTAELQAQIDSVGFHSRTIMGVDGFLTVDIYPVVLFHSGVALTEVAGLRFPGGIEAHQRAKPQSWRRWRRANGRLELESSKGWEPMRFQTTYARFTDGMRLNGLFRSLSGVGTVAIGGADSVAAYNQYQFTMDRHVMRGGAAGGYSETAGGSVATRSVGPSRRGTYRIDGLTLHITYDDGSHEQRILTTDPQNPNKAIWLDGVGYVQRKKW